MTYQNLSATPEYQDALTALQTLEPPSLGFQKPSELTANAREQTAALIKQNNTIIALLVQANSTLNQCKSSLQQIQSSLAPSSSEDPTERALAEIQSKLANLKLDTTPDSRPKVHKPTGPDFPGTSF